MERTDPDWYNKLYDDKIYIPIDTFCKQDYPIIFTKELISKLRNSKAGYVVSDFNGQKLYEVLITATKPSVQFPEGALHTFQFVKTNNAYKFWGIDSIP